MWIIAGLGNKFFLSVKPVADVATSRHFSPISGADFVTILNKRRFPVFMGAVELYFACASLGRIGLNRLDFEGFRIADEDLREAARAKERVCEISQRYPMGALWLMQRRRAPLVWRRCGRSHRATTKKPD